MLKLYTNTDFLTETYRPYVFPLLFDLVFKNDTELLKYYQLVSAIDQADIVVMPIDYSLFSKHKVSLNKLLKLARTEHKPLWIYTAGDFGFTHYIPESYTFRLGGFDSLLPNTTFIMPSFINDPYLEYHTQGFKALPKPKKPTLGFVGHAQSGMRQLLKEYLNHLKKRANHLLKGYRSDKQSFYPSSVKRAYYLNVLKNSPKLDAKFILRTQYKAGSQTTEEQLQKRMEFLDNMFQAPYTFCMRGVGNFSVRFYEALAMGRIPVLLNTDCRLPLRDSIDWNKHCVIVEDKKGALAQQIEDFHHAVTNEAFMELQQSNRDLWLECLRRESYFKQIFHQFKTHLSQ